MLSRIMQEFRESDGVINLDDLSRRLGVERSALDGMLETLVRQGKLRQVNQTAGACDCHCGNSCAGCAQSSREVLGKAYEIVSPSVSEQKAE